MFRTDTQTPKIHYNPMKRHALIFAFLFYILGCSTNEPDTPSPEAKFSFEYKAKGLVEFKNASTFSDEYLWDFGNGKTSNEQNPSHTFEKNGEYKVSLTAKNKNGSQTFSETITIADLHPPVASFTFENKGRGLVEFKSTSQHATSHQWDFGNTKSSTETNPTHTYTTNGEYTVKLTVTNEYGTHSKSELIQLNNVSLPEANFTFSLENGGKVAFTNTSKFAESYQWSFGNGAISTEINPTHTYAENKNYVVTLIAKSTIGETKVEKTIGITNAISLTKNSTIYTSNFTEKSLLQAIDASSGEIKWTKDGFDGRINGSISLENNVLFFTTESSLYATDASNGNVKWRISIGQGSKASPTVYNGTVYLGTADHKVYAINASNGSKKWEVPVISSVVASPTIYNNALYIGTLATASVGGTYYAINLSDGSIKWQRGSYFGSINTAGKISGNNLYYGGSGGIHILNNQHGGLVAHSYLKIENSNPLVYNDRLIGVIEGNRLSKIQVAPESIDWNFDFNASNNFSSPILVENYVYIGSQNKVSALNANNGSTVWTYQGINFISKNLTHAADIIYITDIQGNNTELVALDYKTGKVIFKKVINGKMGDLTVLSKDGKINYSGSAAQK
jgi:PKD repeat protein